MAVTVIVRVVITLQHGLRKVAMPASSLVDGLLQFKKDEVFTCKVDE